MMDIMEFLIVAFYYFQILTFQINTLMNVVILVLFTVLCEHHSRLNFYRETRKRERVERERVGVERKGKRKFSKRETVSPRRDDNKVCFLAE